MSESGWTVSRPLRSDVPLVSDLVERPGERGLRRSIDPGCASSGTAWQDFVEEIQAAVRIGGEHLTLSGALAFEERPTPWLVREFSPETLRRHLLVPVEAEVALSLAVWLTRALRDLHALGLHHGDPSAANVLVRGDGTLRLADPVSSRRRFPGLRAVASLEEEQERDLARVSPFLVNLLAGHAGAAQAPLVREIRAFLNLPGHADRRLVALERLAASNGIGSAPNLAAAPAPEACPAASPVAVTISVPRVDDDRVAYEAAKVLAGLSGSSLSAVRQELRSGGWSGPSSFPQPAGRIAGELRGHGVPLRIHRVPSEHEDPFVRRSEEVR